jgi:hypothetical protein
MRPEKFGRIKTQEREKKMKRWTQDYRYIVWTVTEGTHDRYDLYVAGVLKYTNLSFEQFYPIYKAESAKVS